MTYGFKSRLGHHDCGLKIRRPSQGVPVRFRLEAPQTQTRPGRSTIGPESTMSQYDAPFEIHVHGEVPLRTGVTYAQLQEALKPLWTYAGAKSLADGAESAYEEEPGIKF